MKSNLGKTDRILRTIAGVAIIAVGIIGHSWWGAIGLIPIATAAIRWCPAYHLLGLSTCQPNRSAS
jgi:hypothetical protein